MPATFADAVGLWLHGLDADARPVVSAAPVIGRVDWALLGQVTGLPDAAVVTALRRGWACSWSRPTVQLPGSAHAHSRGGPCRAAVAGTALLAGQALAAVGRRVRACPGHGASGRGLAEEAGTGARGRLAPEAGRRGLAVGALASAKQSAPAGRA